MDERHSVVLVDDHPLVRSALKTLLEQHNFDVLGEGSRCEEAVELVSRLKPTVAVLDLAFPDASIVTVLAQLAERSATTRRFVLTSLLDLGQFVSVLRLNAEGLWLKTASPKHILAAIEHVAKGHHSLDPTIAKRLAQVEDQPVESDERALQQLTARELEVLRALGRGESNEAIAQSLDIAKNTVKGHVSNVLMKLGLEGRTEAAVFAWKIGLVRR